MVLGLINNQNNMWENLTIVTRKHTFIKKCSSGTLETITYHKTVNNVEDIKYLIKQFLDNKSIFWDISEYSEFEIKTAVFKK